jgi:hypothetical protein
LNSKTAKLFRKYAKQQTKTKEAAKVMYKTLKSEFKEYEETHRLINK